MQRIGQRRIGVEDARRVELADCHQAFSGAVRLEEKVITIEPTPGQLLVTIRGSFSASQTVTARGSVRRSIGPARMSGKFANRSANGVHGITYTSLYF